ncbi:DUF6519 domain-containing protein [Arthrobacter sp. B0490]|uniref:DUF6519 domain-containing protein n=1 Tax=Arthrobacter sp. B0490 TaxID=2058891 RepID=UPI0011B0C588|nr:DUF6519 domain-containing protein [Arthrobacter sp. B0490]
MKADISANTFREDRPREAVIFGQGQVLRDADLNEQSAIDRHRVRATAAALIGASGTPTNSPGFGVTVAPNGSDLLLSEGEMWIDGIRLINDSPWYPCIVRSPTVVEVTAPVEAFPQDFTVGSWVRVRAGDGAGATVSTTTVMTISAGTVTLADAPEGMPAVGGVIGIRAVRSYQAQPYLKVDNPFIAGNPGHLDTGAYVVVLDAWERHVTGLEDPTMRDVALGDVDTATRLESVWSLWLAPIGPVGTQSCALPINPAVGVLSASTASPETGQGPCVLPDDAGYRGLENQLYRVEVHHASDSSVVLKWQRDNASTASRVTALGTTLTLANMGRDAASGFATAPFIELTDDAHEFEGRPGDMLSVSSTESNTLTVTTAPSITVLSANVRARRWDGIITIDLTDTDVSAPRALERGLQVALTPGRLSPGDYWTIPARTASSTGGGGIDWPLNVDNSPVSLPPEGIRHHRAALASVDTDGSTFLDAGKPARDCRQYFSTLTEVKPSRGLCTALADPGPGWEKVFQKLLMEGGLVCLPAGEYPVSDSVVVEGTGHLTVRGAGWSSRIVGPGENLLTFKGFASVTVEDFMAESRGPTSFRGPRPIGLVGTLGFDQCATVKVRNVHLTCPRSTQRSAACLRTSGGTVHVSGSTMLVGDRQVGLLLVDAEQTLVTGNVIRPAGSATVKGIGDMTLDIAHRIKSMAIRDLSSGKTGNNRVSATVGAGTWSFETYPEFIPEFTAALKDKYADIKELHRDLQVLATAPMVKRPRFSVPLFTTWARDLLARNPTVVGQAVVVARSARNDSAVGDVVVCDNIIRGAVQGIHIGASYAGQPRYGRQLMLKSVKVEHNEIDVLIPSTGARGRHAIFVGNAHRVLVTGNHATYETKIPGDIFATDGIRVFGYIGPHMHLRENVLEGFPTGIRMVLLGQLPKSRLWRAEDTVLTNLPASHSTIVSEGPLSKNVHYRGNQPGPQDR